MRNVTAKEVIAKAIEELGYKEKQSLKDLDSKTKNSGNKNYTKYARDLHNAGYYQASKNGYSWCDMFVDWVLLQVCGNKSDGEYVQCQTGLYGAGCEWSSDCYRRVGRFGKEPKSGAQIFFGKEGKETHTGIVESYDDSYVYTIEGNTSDMVARRRYVLSDKNIVGYGYMRYVEKVVENKKSNETIAKEVVAGQWGNGNDRKKRLTNSGYDYNEVQKIVNEMLTPSKSNKKSNEAIAKEVVAGQWGNGNDRKKKLKEAGYNYNEVQKIVNKLMKEG